MISLRLRKQKNVHDTIHTLARILIASYFIALASGLAGTPAPIDLPMLPGGLGEKATAAFVFVTAYMVMLGIHIRAAALLLAIYLFWTSFISNYLVGAAPDLGSFWRDMALIGGLLMTYTNRNSRRADRLREQRNGAGAKARGLLLGRRPVAARGGPA